MSTISTITNADLLSRISRLPDNVKVDVVEYIDKRLEMSGDVVPKKPRKAGWGKDLIVSYIEDDKPYEDFREYME